MDNSRSPSGYRSAPWYCGDAVADLRRQGFRTIIDLAALDTNRIAELAKETRLTESALVRAKVAAEDDEEIERLRYCALLLGQYWEGAPPLAPKAAGAA